MPKHPPSTPAQAGHAQPEVRATRGRASASQLGPPEPTAVPISSFLYVKEQRPFYHKTSKPEPKLDSKLFTRESIRTDSFNDKYHMDRITDSIWIGNYLDARDQEAKAKAGIRSILCLDGCLAGTKAEELGIERIEVAEIIDGAGNPPERFLRAVRLLGDLVTKHSPVLVHCHAGQSRSAAVVCKYFMTVDGDSLGVAMRKITSKRRVAIVAGLQEVLDFK
jgi:hypothetical protein